MMECVGTCGFQEMSEVADPAVEIWGRGGWDIVAEA